MPTYEYKCRCGKVAEKNLSVAEYLKHPELQCSCGEQMSRAYSPVYYSGDTQTGGYAGYNESLGVEVKDKGHYKKILKEKGIQRVD